MYIRPAEQGRINNYLQKIISSIRTLAAGLDRITVKYSPLPEGDPNFRSHLLTLGGMELDSDSWGKWVQLQPVPSISCEAW